MDVTSQVLNEVEFHQKMRGYDPDEVDDFLERVAVAFEQLQERVRGAEQRSAIAEQRAAEVARRPGAAVSAPATSAPPVDEADEAETIRRTLVLAQRTADAAVKEARDEARRVLEAAQEQAHRLQSDAQEQARKTVVDAEAEARKSADDTRQRLIKEIISLEETRDALRADHGILERHLDEQRLRLRSSIGDLQRLLDDPGRLRGSGTPELSGVTRPDFVDEEIAAADAEPEASEEADDGAVIDLDAPTTVEPVDDVESRPRTGGVTFTPPEEHNGSSGPVAERSVALATDEDDAWASFVAGDVDRPTMPVSMVEPGDDAYLTELRKAMLEDTSAATLDPGEHRARTRFGRRR